MILKLRAYVSWKRSEARNTALCICISDKCEWIMVEMRAYFEIWKPSKHNENGPYFVRSSQYGSIYTRIRHVQVYMHEYILNTGLRIVKMVCALWGRDSTSILLIRISDWKTGLFLSRSRECIEIVCHSHLSWSHDFHLRRIRAARWHETSWQILKTDNKLRSVFLMAVFWKSNWHANQLILELRKLRLLKISKIISKNTACDLTLNYLVLFMWQISNAYGSQTSHNKRLTSDSRTSLRNMTHFRLSNGKVYAAF